MAYHIKDGYRPRGSPSYFVDTPDQAAACQPDVYSEAAELATALGARTIIDLGCGIADKLATLAETFQVIGVDYGANLEVARMRHPGALLIEWDLEQPGLDISEVRGAVVVCIDVIEHMIRPERLLRLARELLEEGALALVLTTPERDLVRGHSDAGPPANESHVREWNRRELSAFLAEEGLSGFVGLTKSNASVPWFHTTLVVVPSPAAAGDVVAGWWKGRNRYLEAIEDLQEQFQAARLREQHLSEEIVGVRGYVAELEAMRESYASELSDVRSYVAELEAERQRLLARPEVPVTVRGAIQLAGKNAIAIFKERLAARRG